MDRFLRTSKVIDWEHPEVLAQARVLAGGSSDAVQIAKRCFEWVRDEIAHSRDHGLPQVTCSASEVLAAGHGYCYAKSHLLAALLRVNGIPAGICYQRLSRDDNGAPFCLHALNSVHLPGHGWYRIDARGNRDDIDARFDPPVERLAFHIRLPGEADLPEILSEPLPVVVEALRTRATSDELWRDLPDMPPG